MIERLFDALDRLPDAFAEFGQKLAEVLYPFAIITLAVTVAMAILFFALVILGG